MANITFTIPLPVLSAGDSFKYRYKLVGGAYGGYTSVMTQTITLTGLSNGSYIIEIIYVKADLTECAPVEKPFEIVPEFSCYNFNAVIVQSGSQYILRITWAFPSPITNPSCGWRIVWAQTSNNTLTYTSLPMTGVIDIVLPANKNTSLQIIGEICGQNSQFCFEDSVPKIPSPTCIAAQFTSYDIVYTNGFWGIRLMGINSNPATPFYTFNWQETSQTPTPLKDQGTFIFAGGIAGGTFLYTLPIMPQGQFLTNPNNPDIPEYIPNCISYVGNVIDVCGNSIPFQVSGFWTPSTTPGGFGTFVNAGC